MRQNHHGPCLDVAGRATDDQLRAWLHGDAKSDSAPFQPLCRAVTPLLLAFFEGQLRDRRADLDVLVLETLVAVYQGRATCDPGQPFRAWLLDIARLQMTHYRHGACRHRAHDPAACARSDAGFEPVSDEERETGRLLCALLQGQAAVRDAPIAAADVAAHRVMA